MRAWLDFRTEVVDPQNYFTNIKKWWLGWEAAYQERQEAKISQIAANNAAFNLLRKSLVGFKRAIKIKYGYEILLNKIYGIVKKRYAAVLPRLNRRRWREFLFLLKVRKIRYRRKAFMGLVQNLKVAKIVYFFKTGQVLRGWNRVAQRNRVSKPG